MEGINFDEIFSTISKLTYTIFTFSIIIAFDLEVDNMGVKTTFLHEDLKEEIYMKQ